MASLEQNQIIEQIRKMMKNNSFVSE